LPPANIACFWPTSDSLSLVSWPYLNLLQGQTIKNVYLADSHSCKRIFWALIEHGLWEPSA